VFGLGVSLSLSSVSAGAGLDGAKAQLDEGYGPRLWKGWWGVGAGSRKYNVFEWEVRGRA